MKNTKKGISIIVLVITIIVIVILAGATIVALADAGIIGKSQTAKMETAFSNAKETINFLAIDAVTTNHPNTQNIQEVVKASLNQNITTINNIEYINATMEENKIWVDYTPSNNSEDAIVGTIREDGSIAWKTWLQEMAICNIGDALYVELQDAIDAAVDGDIISITKDFEITQGVNVLKSTPSTLTINFNNHIVTSSSTAFFLKSGNKCALTIINAEISNDGGYGAFNNISGKLTDNTPSLILIDCIVTSKGEGTVWNNNGAHSMIVGGTYTNKGILTENRNGLITINNGKFIGKTISNRNRTQMIILNGDFSEVTQFVGMDNTLAENTVTVYGGTYAADISKCVPEGYTVTQNADGFYEVTQNI